MRVRTLFAVLWGLALAAAPALAQGNPSGAAPYSQRAQAALAQNPNATHSPLAVLVRFRAGASPAARAQARAAVRGARVREFAIVPGLELVETPVGVAQAVAALRSHPLVEYAEPDYVVHAGAVAPNDPMFGSLWGMARIRAPEAWQTSTGDPAFQVADIDTGIDYTHPDLQANAWVNPGEVAGNAIDDDGNGYIDDVRGWNCITNTGNPWDDNGHGTHTAGTIGAVGNNGTGVAGVNWQCKIVALKFLNASGSGYISDAIEAVQYAARNGIKVSNNSWGGGGYSSALFDAIKASQAVGHLFVAAAGNDRRNTDRNPSYPACYDLDNVLSVAAMDSSDAVASFSNYGAKTVDLGAPGVGILSTVPGGGYQSYSGTSMACPHVAGAAALVYAANPTWTYAHVRSQILGTVRPVASLVGKSVTGGALDAYAALSGTVVSLPAAPSGLTVSVTAPGQARLTWVDNSDNEAGFTIQRQVLVRKKWTNAAAWNVGAGVSSATDSPGAGTYRYRVSAFNSAGASSATGWVQVNL